MYMNFLRFLPILTVLFLTSACDNPPVETKVEKKVEPRNEQDGIGELTDEILADPTNPNLYVKRALAYQKQQLFELRRNTQTITFS